MPRATILGFRSNNLGTKKKCASAIRYKFGASWPRTSLYISYFMLVLPLIIPIRKLRLGEEEEEAEERAVNMQFVQDHTTRGTARIQTHSLKIFSQHHQSWQPGMHSAWRGGEEGVYSAWLHASSGRGVRSRCLPASGASAVNKTPSLAVASCRFMQIQVLYLAVI